MSSKNLQEAKDFSERAANAQPKERKDLPASEYLRDTARMTPDPMIVARIQAEASEWGSMREAARVLGFPHQYLHQVLAGKTPASDKLLAALGLERRIHKIPKNRMGKGKRDGQV